MTDPIPDLKRLAEARNIKLTEYPKQHFRLELNGLVINYWPLSRNRTVHVYGFKPRRHLSPADVITLLIKPNRNDFKQLNRRKKRIPKNKRRQNVSGHTNPRGVTEFYSGSAPPWDTSA